MTKLFNYSPSDFQFYGSLTGIRLNKDRSVNRSHASLSLILNRNLTGFARQNGCFWPIGSSTATSRSGLLNKDRLVTYVCKLKRIDRIRSFFHRPKIVSVICIFEFECGSALLSERKQRTKD